MKKIKLSLNEEISRIKDMMEIEHDVKHIYQPDGVSCGPTCLKMVGDFIKGNVGEIDDICAACGTDMIVGTPPDKMKIGLKQLGINYIEHIKEIEPYQSIKNVIDKGNVCIVRTVTRGAPHWIVINGYDGDVFSVNDPWLGPIKYNQEQLGGIWKIRDFFFFEIVTGKQQIISGVKIERMTEDDIDVIKPNLSDVFDKTGLSNDEIFYLLGEFDYNLSVVAKVGDEVAGFYFLGNGQMPGDDEPEYPFHNLRGIEGIALGVFKKFKNMGVGKYLINYSRQIPGVDYIWGYQFKSLKNIDDWLKRRKIYWENDKLYLTYEILNKKGIE